MTVCFNKINLRVKWILFSGKGDGCRRSSSVKSGKIQKVRNRRNIETWKDQQLSPLRAINVSLTGLRSERRSENEPFNQRKPPSPLTHTHTLQPQRPTLSASINRLCLALTPGKLGWPLLTHRRIVRPALLPSFRKTVFTLDRDWDYHRQTMS